MKKYPKCQKKVWRFRHIFVAYSEYMNFTVHTQFEGEISA